MAITKQKKQELVASYVETLGRAQGVVVTEYRGMTMAQLSALRTRLQEVDGQYTVTKNTLFKLALKEVGMAAPEALFVGPVAVGVAYSDLPGMVKALLDAGKDESLPLVVKGGVIGQSVLNAAQLEQLTTLPPIETLRAQLAGLIASPATNIVSLLNEPARDVVSVLNAASTQVLNVLAAYVAKAEQEAA